MPGGGIGPVVAAHVPEPDAGLKRAAVASVVLPFKPPAASTRPSANSVAVNACRAALRLPAEAHVPAVALYSWAVVRLLPPVVPPATSTRPLVVGFDPVLSWTAAWRY